MKRTRSILCSLLLLSAFATPSDALAAGARYVVGGVIVQYSLPGMTAAYDPGDDTLTISVTQSGGNLTVTATPDAPDNWGSYVDVFLVAPDIQFKTANFKGRSDCRFYVTGQCYNFVNFLTQYGSVGGTDSYGERGIGTSGPASIPKILIRNGVTFGPIGGVDYTPQALNAKRDAVVTSKRKK